VAHHAVTERSRKNRMSDCITNAITKPDTSFVTRVLISMRDDIENLLETAARIQIDYDTLAKEHGLNPTTAPVNTTGA